MSEDPHRREKILAKLAQYFPSQSSPQRSLTYLNDLRRFRFKIADVAEGVERVIATREQGTFPSFAVLLAAIKSAQADRVRAENAQDAPGSTIRLGDGSSSRISQEEARQAVLDARKLRVDLGLVRPSYFDDRPLYPDGFRGEVEYAQPDILLDDYEPFEF